LKFLPGRKGIFVLALVAPAAAVAQPAAGPYVNLGAGANFLQNAVLKPAGEQGVRLDFAPGAAVAASAGVGLGGGLRLELEGDFTTSRARGAKADMYGGFVNAFYDFTTGTGFVPYLGIGAGYQTLDLDGGGAETGSAFGYQGIAGLSYPVGLVPGLSLTAEYRLVGSALFAGGPPVSNVFDHQALLGLRYAFGTPPLPPLPDMLAPLPPPPSAARVRTYLVFFDWDRADLSARARQIVAQAAEASRHVQTTRIEVSGYTDASGTQTYNQTLSVRRAQTVEAELVRDGVATTDITIHGFGESNPLVPTAPGVREPPNRRVEIVLK
jgi:outer membrane protein OmpA-like peptidoglycan-associated protein